MEVLLRCLYGATAGYAVQAPQWYRTSGVTGVLMIAGYCTHSPFYLLFGLLHARVYICLPCNMYINIIIHNK